MDLGECGRRNGRRLAVIDFHVAVVQQMKSGARGGRPVRYRWLPFARFYSDSRVNPLRATSACNRWLSEDNKTPRSLSSNAPA